MITELVGYVAGILLMFSFLPHINVPREARGQRVHVDAHHHAGVSTPLRDLLVATRPDAGVHHEWNLRSAGLGRDWTQAPLRPAAKGTLRAVHAGLARTRLVQPTGSPCVCVEPGKADPSSLSPTEGFPGRLSA